MWIREGRGGREERGVWVSVLVSLINKLIIINVRLIKEVWLRKIGMHRRNITHNT